MVPSRPAAKTNSFWSESNPVNGDKDLPKGVLSRAFLSGEAELSNNMLDIRYVPRSSSALWLSPSNHDITT